MTNKVDKVFVGICVVILIFSMFFFSSMGLKEEKKEEESSEEEAVLDATRAFLAGGKNTMITAEALYANLNDNYGGNDPYILSVRSESQYAVGHIPGAHNIPWRSVFTEENISKLPKNKQIVVVCYTGHTASQITALLNVYDYDAVCLKWGMCSWTTNETVTANKYYSPPTTDFPIATGATPGTWTVTRTRCGGDEPAPSPAPVDTGSGDDVDLRGDIHGYLASSKADKAAISAADLYANLNDGDTSNDPFVLSIRSSSQYEIGHIPGAVNIGFKTLFTDDNLSKLPDNDQQIVVVCYTGHTASQATALLNINGYTAVPLKFGMTGWTSNSTYAPSAFNKATACANFPVSVGEEAGDIATAVIADTAEVVLTATNDFLSAGKGTQITAEAVYANLNDGYSGNDPYILSIRSSTQYAVGHVPGAVNIPLASLFTEENISTLPTNKQIVVYCYTGHTASQATVMLNVLGFDAVCMKFGMTSWTTNTTVAPGAYNPSTVVDYPVVTGSEPETWTPTRDCGDPVEGGGTTETATGSVFDIVRATCNNYIGAGKPWTMKAGDLYDNLNDGDTSNDPFILSIRSPTQYAIGHIPGAVNIGMADLFTEENMAKLPDDDTQIVVVCYTGHTASQTAALLNINGYNATAMKFGMTGWTTDTAVAPYAYDKGTQCHNYPVIIGTQAGDLTNAVVVGLTDAEILLNAVSSYAQGGYRMISAPDLYDLLNDTDPDNDPFILSIRSGSQYEIGHIPEAVNIPWRSLFSLENLSKLPSDDTLIVVVCYTGHSASQITALLNVLGFNASTLRNGMTSWTTNTTVAPGSFDKTTDQNSYPTCNGSEPGSTATATRACGDDGGGTGATYEGSADEWEILRQAAERYVNEVLTMTITSTAVYNNLYDGYSKNDPYILSIRSGPQYEIGHIPGAENIGYKDLFTEKNIATLPMDKQIVVVCYTAHTASQTTALLCMLGYNAITLRFGMCSWSDNSTIAPYCFDPATSSENYPVSTGSEEGDWDTAKPVG